VNLAEQNLKYQQRFLARVQDRFQSGQSKLADVARVKLEVAKASNDLLVAEKNHKVAQAQLNTLMGQAPRQALPDAEHLKEEVIQLNEETLIQQAAAHRPEFKSIEASQKAAQSELSLANRLLWTPDLTAGVVLQEGAREDGKNSWGGKLGLAFPVWYRYRGERLSASARKDSLGFQSKGLEQMISLEVHEAMLEIDLSGEQVKLWKQAVDQATEAARLAEQQYLEGDVDLLVFVQARRDLVSATLDYLEALRNYQVNVASLERSVGINLSEVK
jgi:outer membrane protein TolC